MREKKHIALLLKMLGNWNHVLWKSVNAQRFRALNSSEVATNTALQRLAPSQDHTGGLLLSSKSPSFHFFPSISLNWVSFLPYFDVKHVQFFLKGLGFILNLFGFRLSGHDLYQVIFYFFCSLYCLIHDLCNWVTIIVVSAILI